VGTRLCPPHLIDINGITALGRLAVEDGKLVIGACVRHAAFHRPPVDGPLGALLARVVRHIAHYPIRTRGTFCGSVANADPASEWCTLTVALGAEMVAESARGRRVIPADKFFAGIMTTALAEDELLTEVRLPLLTAGTRAGFYEFSRRAGDFAIAMALATYRVEGGKIVDPRVAVGGAEAEQALAGHPPGPAAFTAAAERAAAAVDPMEDINNSAEYRRELVRAVTRRALEQAAKDDK
jgi:carbon-monoxide dehydrogenase medium subunit